MYPSSADLEERCWIHVAGSMSEGEFRLSTGERYYSDDLLGLKPKGCEIRRQIDAAKDRITFFHEGEPIATATRSHLPKGLDPGLFNSFSEPQ